MRFPHVININTKEEYDPSNVSLELSCEVNRKVFPENLNWGDTDFPSLVVICVWAISKSFKNKQIFHKLPGAEKDLLLEILPTNLPLALVVPLIKEEIYWKRRYLDKFKIITERLYKDWNWKRLFIERYMQEVLEEAQPQYKDEETFMDLTKLCCPYIKRLIVTQLQSWKPPLTWVKEQYPEVFPLDHINFEPVLKELYNIEEFNISYGAKSVGESFNWHMFKLSVLDTKRLGNAILSLKNLRILRINRSKLEDAHCQALMQGLIQNKTLIELDLSHCQIRDNGALCIAKVMMVHPTLEIIKLCNNKIKSIGTQGIGFALLQESCCPLSHLDLRLNHLEHDGVMGILRSLVRGNKPRELSLAACGFEEDTPIRVGQMLNINKTLEVLDISSNWFGEEGGAAVLRGLLNNRMLKLLDTRETNIPKHYLSAIQKLLKRNRLNEDQVEEDELVEICEETLEENENENTDMSEEAGQTEEVTEENDSNNVRT